MKTLRLPMHRLWTLVCLAAACTPEPETVVPKLAPAAGAPQAATTAKAESPPPSATAAKQAPASPASGRGAGAPLVSAHVDGVELQLTECQLSVSVRQGPAKTLSADLPGNCVFVATSQGVQVEDTPHGKVALIVSSTPLEGRPGRCDTRVRAAVVKDQTVTLSRETQRLRLCGAQGPFDTLMFHTLADGPAQ